MHIKALCRLIRPQQWIKNGFVFLPIFFGRSLFDAHIWAYAIIAFIAFCGISSAVYCMNDIRDVASDRRHPRKCRRPIASGLISVNQAWITFVILVCISFALSVLCLNPTSGMYVSLILLTYLILNVAYSSGLKKVSILDVFIISLGFVLRLVAGGVAENIKLTPWIVLMTFLLTLFLAFAKRRDDVIMLEKHGRLMRASIKNYNIQYMDATLGILASVTIVCYIMFCVSPEVVERIGNEYVYISSIFVIAGILRFLQIAIVKKDCGSPTDIIIHDKFMLCCITLWIVFFFLILY